MDDATCHCYKCNSYQPILGGVTLLDSRKRRRFVCARCYGLIKPREARPTAAPAVDIAA